jgi:uncharacterized protein (DUF2062 family)
MRSKRGRKRKEPSGTSRRLWGPGPTSLAADLAAIMFALNIDPLGFNLIIAKLAAKYNPER